MPKKLFKAGRGVSNQPLTTMKLSGSAMKMATEGGKKGKGVGDHDES